MNPAHLTQQQFLARLRSELGIVASPSRVHAWVREGMPTAPRGGRAKPRFVWGPAVEWLLNGTAHQPSPVSQDVRDRLFLASLKRGA